MSDPCKAIDALLTGGQMDGASWRWRDHQGQPVLTIRDLHDNRVTLAPEQLLALLDFLAERSPEVLMQVYETCYAWQKREADEEEA